MNRFTIVCALVALCICAGNVDAQSFGLDDNPQAPLVGPPGPIPGLGAEDPFAFIGPPLAPSPSLGFLGAQGDGAILGPGPFVQHSGPNGFYISAFSRSHAGAITNIGLQFSVDRMTLGIAGSAVGTQSALGQAHGDIFQGRTFYMHPGFFAGTLGAGPFAGVLPSIVGGAPDNFLRTDESLMGLVTPLGVVGPGVPVPPPLAAPGQHDNVDSFDRGRFDPDGDGLFNQDLYFTIYPDEAIAVGGVSPSDIFVVAAGDPGAIPVPYAPFASMGLQPGEDAIDGLVMFDNNLRPIPTDDGGPGDIEAVVDYALFSLAPGSLSLQIFNLNAGDIFFTDFTGAFALYAASPTLGLLNTPPGIPFQGDNVDALEAVGPNTCPEDLNGDGVVDVLDLLQVLGSWGGPGGDVNGDGTTDVLDLLAVLSAWGPCEPGNDECENAVALPIPAFVPGTTTDASFDAVPFCDFAHDAAGVWYSVIGDGTTLSAQTCGGAAWDTRLTVYCDDCDNLNCVAANDDSCGGLLQSQVSWCSQPGVRYLILVHGFAGATGEFNMLVTSNGLPCEDDNPVCVPPPADECADGPRIGEVIGLEFDTTNATPDGPFGCFPPSPNVWVCYTPTCTGTVRIDTCGSSFDTTLCVYIADNCDPIDSIAGNDDCPAAGPCGGTLQSCIEMTAIAGQQLKIEIGGFQGAVGPGVLNITCSPGG